MGYLVILPRRLGRIALLLPLLVGASGCNLVALPWLLWGKKPTRNVPAEYPYLAGKSVCVAVWADSNTLFEYPFVQLELAEHLAAAIEPQIEQVSFVPARDVVDLQRSEPDWDREHESVIGARFRVDRVLRVDLTQYTTREPDSPHLMRGRIAASIKVFDSARPDASPLYRAMVESVYPENTSGEWGSDDRAIRKATLEAFAAKVARKFYDHNVEVK